ncbi:HepT-like ribonuclease domain-containing protein [Zhihengliuella salsuginis]|uniref:DUF86 domain-containing protein n=1 Tax=Zhihengliuella salsuginis TaxID=578222 RepID=A0ABQ3GFY1_9MICC|nr:HepT-like ribonuclease domain-containing protein [Zhihengliuella salsuginis]GHD03198.1 DUF86 domain-containing protein [Zhihengliuella salsuginis]
MTRDADERIDDILNAVERCRTYRPWLVSTDEVAHPMAYDAVLRNLAVIGEAARALPDHVRSDHPEIPWPAIIGLRNVVIHEYFRVDESVITAVIDENLLPLAAALRP